MLLLVEVSALCVVYYASSGYINAQFDKSGTKDIIFRAGKESASILGMTSEHRKLS